MKIINKIYQWILQLLRISKKNTHQRSPIYLRIGLGKKILLYTDSRGINIPGHYDFQHYSTRLILKYNVDAYLCPEKWTTILDFLALWKQTKIRNYDFVILHAGIVDASPRHQQVAYNKIYLDKKNIFDDVFSEKKISAYLKTDLKCDYEGDKTINMYSLQMAEENLIPRLIEIPNLIWIGTNRIDKTWRGNYWKERPENIQLVEEYSKLFTNKLPRVIDLLEAWSLAEVRYFTFDNVHPNKEGSEFIYRKIENIINNNYA